MPSAVVSDAIRDKIRAGQLAQWQSKRELAALGGGSLQGNVGIGALRCESCSSDFIGRLNRKTCDSCRDRQNKDKRLSRIFGITLEQYEYILARQGGTCAICKQVRSNGRTSTLSVDHCHERNVVRGLLCDKCNAGIGYFCDNVNWLLAAARYLVQARTQSIAMNLRTPRAKSTDGKGKS